MRLNTKTDFGQMAFCTLQQTPKANKLPSENTGPLSKIIPPADTDRFQYQKKRRKTYSTFAEVELSPQSILTFSKNFHVTQMFETIPEPAVQESDEDEESALIEEADVAEMEENETSTRRAINCI